MICPHCSTSLQRKERERNRCARCRKEFALEPKDNPLNLHDVRVRRLARIVSDPLRLKEPRLPYTADQLRWAASRIVLIKGPKSESLGWAGAAAAGAVVPTIMALAFDAPGFFLVLVFGLWAVAAIGLINHAEFVRSHRMAGDPISAVGFDGLMSRWERVYGELPPGMIRPGTVTDAWPSTPPVALLYCADVGIVRFLAAAGIVERRHVALISSERSLKAAVQAHPALPVLVLHPADPAGCLVAPRLQSALPPDTHVIDVGLRPRVARRAGPPVRFHPSGALLDELKQAGSLDADEVAWLAKGNTFPLAALRPARLLAAVERAITRVDPEERRAAGLGFLHWPEPVG